MTSHKKLISFGAALLASIILAPVGASAAVTTTDTTPASTVSSDPSQNNASANDTNANDENAVDNPDILNSPVVADPTFDDNQLSIELAASHKKRHIINGVNKLVSHGMTHTTAYISGTNAKLAIEGATLVGSAYLPGRTLQLLLNLAGLGSTTAIKGGVRLEITYVRDWNGAYHQTLTGWGWQYSK